MVDISAAIATARETIASGGQSSVTGSESTQESFDTFLSLLTTQLQNQDPTKPLDTNEMTQQLIQYSEVEQLLQSNKNWKLFEPVRCQCLTFRDQLCGQGNHL